MGVRRIILLLILVCLILTLPCLWFLWFVHTTGSLDNNLDFIEPPNITAPRIAGVSKFRTQKVGDRFEIVDENGRVIILKGLNIGLSALQPPFRAIEMGDENTFRLVSSLGFNAIRLIVTWEALEIEPRRFNLEHLAYIKWFIQTASKYGLTVVVTGHINNVSRCLGGAGVPLWAHRKGLIPQEVIDNGCIDVIPNTITNIGRRLKFWADFYDGRWSPDDISLQDHVIWTWVKLAEVLRNHKGVLGYAPFETPECFGGIWRWLYPGRTTCEDAVHDFYRRLANAIRAVDPDTLIFFTKPDHYEGLFSLPKVEGVVFSHCPIEIEKDGSTLKESIDLVLDIASSAPVVLGNIWTRKDDLEIFSQCTITLEDYRISAFFWDYSKIGSLPKVEWMGFQKDNKVRCMLSYLVRPYPMRVSGILVEFGFNKNMEFPYRFITNQDAFFLRFKENGIKAPTLVWVPRWSVFGEDPNTEAPEFTVDVSDGKWQWSPVNPEILMWTTNPEVEEHTLVIKTWGGQPAKGNGIEDCL